MKIYLDLDGPILNPKQRYWMAHFKAVVQLGGKPYKDASYYWVQKQNFISKKIILTECQVSLDHESQYIEMYAALVESEELLLLDKLQPQAKKTLYLLSKSHQLVLVSARSNSDNLIAQLKNLDIYSFFTQFLITNTRPGQNQDGDKADLIKKESEQTMELGKVIVGDTNAEINASKQLDLISIVVLNGLRTKKFLKQFDPDYMISGIKQLPQLLKQIDLV